MYYDLSFKEFTINREQLFKSSISNDYLYKMDYLVDVIDQPDEAPSMRRSTYSPSMCSQASGCSGGSSNSDDYRSNRDNAIISNAVSTPINIKKDIIPKTNDYSWPSSPVGYLYNIYNTEQCDDEWLAFMYIINQIYTKFTVEDLENPTIAIKSLHVEGISGSILPALNHFLYNSDISDKNKIEWDWRTASTMQYNTLEAQKMIKKYSNKILSLLNGNLYSGANINILTSGTLNALGKINLLVSRKLLTSIKEYVLYAALSIQLFEDKGILYIRIPEVYKWDTKFVNILLLYSGIFSKVKLYMFDLKSEALYLVCKYRKEKLFNQRDQLYKRLLQIISNPLFTEDHNIFRRSIFSGSVKTWVKKVQKLGESSALEIYGKKSCDINTITLDSILLDISNVIKPNTKTFV